MGQATKEDAQLLVQLARLAADMKLGEASGFIWSGEFVEDYDEFKAKFPWGSEGAKNVAAAAGFNETVGTLVKHGLIDEELVRDWLAFHLLWGKLEKILLGMREDAGEPRLYENFEAVATAQVEAPTPA
jgi:hypothetical protein